MNHGCNLSRATGAQTDAVDTPMLLHPARHFRNPKDVLNANYLSSEEKRTILASWACRGIGTCAPVGPGRATPNSLPGRFVGLRDPGSAAGKAAGVLISRQ